MGNPDEESSPVVSKKKRLDPRLQVTDEPRAVPSREAGELPLVTLAWRILRAEGRRRAREQSHQQAVYVSIAERVFQLRRLAGSGRGAAGAPEAASLPAELLAICARLEASLAELGLTLVIPQGQPYTNELMDLVENIAQVTDASLSQPLVAEVIAPAILYQGAVLRMGKAVIAIPAQVKDNRVDESPDEVGGAEPDV